MSVSIQITSLGLAGVGYAFSDPASANGNTVNALEMVRTAQLMLDGAAQKMQAALDTLSEALRELAAVEPPKPGEDGKIDPAAQAAYEAKLQSAKAAVSRANQDVLKANFDYRTAEEALDRANMMLPVAEQRDEAQRKAFEDSKHQIEEQQKQIDDSMKRALESAKQLEQKQPDLYWAFDAIRSVARDVDQGLLRGAGYLAGNKARTEQKTVEQQQAALAQQLAAGAAFGGSATRDTFATAPRTSTPTQTGNVVARTGLATASVDRDDVDTRARAVHVLLRNNMMTSGMARSMDWQGLRGAANTAQLVTLLSVNAHKAHDPAERHIWDSAAQALDGSRVQGLGAA